MIRFAFRLHRWGMVGVGLVILVATLAQAAAYESVAGNTDASRAAFAQSMGELAAQLSYLLPLPHHLETLSGYVQWRAYGAMALVVAIWMITAAAGAVRGDEEKQLVDTWLAAGVSRGRLIAGRIGGFGLAALVAATVGGLGGLLGSLGYQPLSLPRLAGETLALWLLMVCGFALCVLVAQIPATPRGAQAACAGLILTLYLCDAAARNQPALDPLAWISPFKWYEQTDVLAPGGRLSIAGIALSVIVAVAAGGLAALAFQHRDVGGSLLRRAPDEAAQRDGSPSPLLGWPVARQLYQQRWMLLTWLAGSGVLAVFMVGLARGAVDSLGSSPAIRAELERGGADPYRAFVAIFWFGVAQLLLAGFAIHVVSGWAGEDGGGVLEALLSTPRSRRGIILERAGAAAAGVTLVIVFDSLLVFLTAASIGIRLGLPSTVRASWLLIPFSLTFAAIGAAGSSWRPRVTVGGLAGLAILSYFAWELVPLLSWPKWVGDLSIFQLYGTPLTGGIFWGGLLTMIALVTGGFGLAAVLMQRREVGR